MKKASDTAGEWLCDDDTLPKMIAEAAARNPVIGFEEKSVDDWLVWWDRARRFRSASAAAKRRLDSLASDLASERISPAQITSEILSCSHAPSLITLCGALRGIDSGALAAWNQWTEHTLLPGAEIELLPEVVVPPLARRDDSNAFARSAAWRGIGKTVNRLEKGYSTKVSTALRALLQRTAVRDRAWCCGTENGGVEMEAPGNQLQSLKSIGTIRLGETLRYLGKVPPDLEPTLNGAKTILAKILAEEFVDHIKSGDSRAALSLLDEAYDHGISSERVLGECPKGPVQTKGEALLASRKNETASALLATARARLDTLDASDQGASGEIAYRDFADGVDALAEAIALGASPPPDLKNGLWRWRDEFLKLSRLKRLNSEAERFCAQLEARKRELRSKSDGELEEQLEEIEVGAKRLRSAYHSVNAKLAGPKQERKSDFKEDGFRPAKRLIERESTRRRSVLIRRVATAAVFCATAWLAIDTFRRASENADQRILELVTLRESTEIEDVESTLSIANSTTGIDGLFRHFPKWQQEVEETYSWTAGQRELREQITELVDRLQGFEHRFVRYPGLLSGADWNDAVKNWMDTGEEFEIGTSLIGRLAPGVARAVKQKFDSFLTMWGEELNRRGESLGSEIDALANELESLLSTAEQNRANADIDELSSAFSAEVANFERLDASLAMLSDQPFRLGAIHAGGLRAQERIGGQRPQIEAIHSGLAGFQQELERLSRASGIPTYAMTLESANGALGNVERFLPLGTEADIETVKNSLKGGVRFEDLVFREFDSLAAIPRDMPVPSNFDDKTITAMIDLLDDWRVKDIQAWRTGAEAPIVAYSRGRPVSQTQENGTTKWNIDAYILKSSQKSALFRNYSSAFTGTGSNMRNLEEFPGGKPELSKESEFFESLNLHLSFSTPTRLFRNSPVYALDKVIARAAAPDPDAPAVSLVFLAYLHLQLGEVIVSNPKAWGADLTSFERDFSALKSLRRDGILLELKSEDWMVPDVARLWKSSLESYYVPLVERSYVQEFRENTSAVKAVAGSSFEFSGFVDVSKRPRFGTSIPPGRILWGLRKTPGSSELEGVPAFQTGENGVVTELNQVARLSPLFLGSESMDSFLEKAATKPVLKRILRFQG